MGKHLESTYDTAETQDDIKLLRAQVGQHFLINVFGSVRIVVHLLNSMPQKKLTFCLYHLLLDTITE